MEIGDVKRLEVRDGDVLIVTLPEMTGFQVDVFRKRIVETFVSVFEKKEISAAVVVLQHGTKVEVMSKAELEEAVGQ